MTVGRARKNFLGRGGNFSEILINGRIQISKMRVDFRNPYLKIKYMIVLLMQVSSFSSSMYEYVVKIPFIDCKYLHISQFLTLEFEKLIDACSIEVEWG